MSGKTAVIQPAQYFPVMIQRILIPAVLCRLDAAPLDGQAVRILSGFERRGQSLLSSGRPTSRRPARIYPRR